MGVNDLEAVARRRGRGGAFTETDTAQDVIDIVKPARIETASRTGTGLLAAGTLLVLPAR